MNKTDVSQWDTYAALYDKGMGPGGDHMHTARIDPLILSFTGNPAGKNVIDLGCGNGYLYTKLPGISSYTGIDASRMLIDQASARMGEADNARFIHADITKSLPPDLPKADIVICSMVLQYIEQIDGVAASAAELLVKGGICIIIVDHPAHLLYSAAQAAAGKESAKFVNPGSYFSEGPREKKSLWDKAVLTFYHRPIASYINVFTQRFHLDRMEELSEDGEMPRILGMKWVKEI